MGIFSSPSGYGCSSGLQGWSTELSGGSSWPPWDQRGSQSGTSVVAKASVVPSPENQKERWD